MLAKLVGAAAGLALVASTANADDYIYNDHPGMYRWYEPELATGFGLGVQLGGGVNGFTGSTMRDAVTGGVGGLWDVRVIFGTHLPLAFEAAYLGQSAQISAFGAPNGSLLGTTVEGDLRWNMVPHYVFTPYIFAGVGYQRYDVSGMPVADIGIASTDNLVEFPMGLGLSWRDPSGFTADLRGTYRQTTDSHLIQNPDGTNANLSWWEASASVGYEF
jgi:opacity protein-like surface antigen